MKESRQPRYKDGQGGYMSLEEYRKTKVDDLRVRIPKGYKQLFTDYVADSDYKSLNAFIFAAITEKIERDNPDAYQRIMASVSQE